MKRAPLQVRFEISGTPLSLVNSMRYLGVIVDIKLNFSDHIDATVKRGNRALDILIRSIQGVRCGYSKAGVVAAYYANVRSILKYGSVIWAGAATWNLVRAFSESIVSIPRSMEHTYKYAKYAVIKKQEDFAKNNHFRQKKHCDWVHPFQLSSEISLCSSRIRPEM